MSVPQRHEPPASEPDPYQLLPQRPLGAIPVGLPAAQQRPAAPRADLDVALVVLEKKRRALARLLDPTERLPPLLPTYLAAATRSSFALDGVTLAREDLDALLARGAAGRPFRSRQAQRVRNHVAVLRHAERLVRGGQPLETNDVIRWYASIACGLSTAAIDGPTQARLADVVARVNSPQLRLRPAIEDAAALHLALLRHPFVPAFNGILARVLLHAHLGRCGLPPVVFPVEQDARCEPKPDVFAHRLVELLITAYDALVVLRRNATSTATA